MKRDETGLPTGTLQRIWVCFLLAHEADSVIEEIQGLKAGGIRISAGNTLGAYCLLDILDLFRKKHPRVEIRMNVSPVTGNRSTGGKEPAWVRQHPFRRK
jgi:hypothetical protein